MIVFALYLHVCATQPMMRGGKPGQTVTACSTQMTGKLYASQDLCDQAGKAAVAAQQPTADSSDTVRKVDTYACQQQTVQGN